jgi:hypothetical protein
VVDHLVQRAAAGLGDGAQRAISGVAHAEEEGHVITRDRETEAWAA